MSKIKKHISKHPGFLIIYYYLLIIPLYLIPEVSIFHCFELVIFTSGLLFGLISFFLIKRKPKAKTLYSALLLSSHLPIIVLLISGSIRIVFISIEFPTNWIIILLISLSSIVSFYHRITRFIQLIRNKKYKEINLNTGEINIDVDISKLSEYEKMTNNGVVKNLLNFSPLVTAAGILTSRYFFSEVQLAFTNFGVFIPLFFFFSLIPKASERIAILFEIIKIESSKDIAVVVVE